MTNGQLCSRRPLFSNNMDVLGVISHFGGMNFQENYSCGFMDIRTYIAI
jgi:hypothetical protein